MTHALYIVGGQQRASRPLFADDHTWYEYQKGLILRVDTETGVVSTQLEYISPSTVRGEKDPIIFKAATLEQGQIYACTQTEVMIFSLPDFQRTTYFSLPCFNDVHHMRPSPAGNLLIANSGLDMVLEATHQGEAVQIWSTLGENPWAHFSPDTDYRMGVSTKPHRSHPNYVFYVDGEPWATRFQQKDALCLTDPSKRIHIGREHIHDGVVHNGLIYFTTVDGMIIVANPRTLQVEESIDLNTMAEPNTQLGWCRGIYLDGDTIWVGFTRIRPTRFREAVSWVRQGFSRILPTHVSGYNLVSRTHLRDIELEDYGLNAVFSVLPAPSASNPTSN